MEGRQFQREVFIVYRKVQKRRQNGLPNNLPATALVASATLIQSNITNGTAPYLQLPHIRTQNVTSLHLTETKETGIPDLAYTINVCWYNFISQGCGKSPP